MASVVQQETKISRSAAGRVILLPLWKLKD